MHETIVRDLKQEHEKRLEQRETELKETFEKEKQAELEKEQLKCSHKIEAMRSQFRNEFDRLLRDKVAEIDAYTQNVTREQIELNKREAKKHLEVRDLFSGIFFHGKFIKII